MNRDREKEMDEQRKRELRLMHEIAPDGRVKHFFRKAAHPSPECWYECICGATADRNGREIAQAS